MRLKGIYAFGEASGSEALTLFHDYMFRRKIQLKHGNYYICGWLCAERACTNSMVRRMSVKLSQINFITQS